MIHLDTTFLVDLLRESGRQQQGPASQWLDEHRDDELAISVFVACELYNGAERSNHPDTETEKVRSLCAAVHVASPDEGFPPIYGRVLAGLQQRGETISTMDLLIATTCLRQDAPLVTRNVRHFERVPGLRLLAY
jgi:predicted nucleic acid-binding protein